MRGDLQPASARGLALSRGALVGGAILLAMLVLLVGWGVSFGDALLYLGYEAVFVVLPGCLAYMALGGGGGRLRVLALGWALGYVLEILAFMATAALGVRDLLLVYPLIVAVPAILAIRRRGASDPEPVADPEGEAAADPPQLAWFIGGVTLVALVYVALAYFPGAPLPGEEASSYFIDYPRWIALAADAKNHWPIMDPSVAGEPLPYHYFINVHMASASQVTGLGLPLIYLRLFILPLVVVSVLLFVVAGRALLGSSAAGLVAAAMATLVGEVRLDPTNTLTYAPFWGLFFTLLFRSPSFLLGLVLIFPLLILLGERIREGAPGGWGRWLLLLLFMIGASDAKVTILPLLAAALALYGVLRWVEARRIPPAVFGALGMAVAVVGAIWLMQYRSASSGLELTPFAVFDQMPAVRIVKDDLLASLGFVPDALIDIGGVAFGVLGLLLAPLVGIAWVVRRRGFRLGESRTWLLSVLASGLVLAFLLTEAGTQNGLYFAFYGCVAGYLLSADGLRIAWGSRPRGSAVPRALALGAAFVAVLACLVALPAATDLFSGARADAHVYMLRYGGLALALVLLYVAGRRLLGPGRGPAAALVTAGILLAGTLSTPFADLRFAFTDGAAQGREFAKPVTPGLYDAMSWIREETPEDAVVAVNNQWIDYGNAVPLEFNYSAFTERRVYLEGWGYSQRSRDAGYEDVLLGENPFADRLAANTAALAGQREGLDALAAAGVDYVLVDRSFGTPVDVENLERAGLEVVYENADAVVLSLNRSL